MTKLILSEEDLKLVPKALLLRNFSAQERLLAVKIMLSEVMEWREWGFCLDMNPRLGADWITLKNQSTILTKLTTEGRLEIWSGFQEMKHNADWLPFEEVYEASLRSAQDPQSANSAALP